MTTISFFFRHPHRIYFSIEKLFHAIAAETARQLSPGIVVRETALPFTSSLRSIRKNIRFAAANQTEINHITGDIHYAILGCSKNALNILTIHDCVLLHQYPWYSPKHQLILWLWYRMPVKKANVVTVISENTKNDLVRFTGCDREKIVVIPDFIDSRFQPVPRLFNTGCPVILFVGTAPNKNLPAVIEAVSGMAIELVIVGFPSPLEQAEIKKRGIACRILNGLSDEEMRGAYAAADLLLFPSLHEGFGLPVLEAQATGRAVVTSRLEPMISVAGEAACFVDPASAGSIREGVERVVADAGYREQLIRDGFDNVRRFQLSAIAAQYAALYHETNKNKPNR